MKKWSVGLVIVVILFICFYFFLLDTSDPLAEYKNINDPDDRIKREFDYIKITREYQIDLDKQRWRYNREEVAKEFFAFLNAISDNHFNFSYESHIEEGYHRYSFDTIPKTFRNLIVRQRDYLVGPRKGLTTVDYKYRDQDTLEEALQKKARPAAALFLNSTQKVELDIHACDVRWSRGTRVFLDYPVNFTTVRDMKRIFPDIDTHPGISLDYPIKHQSFDVYYWQLSHSGTLPDGLHYKTTITFFWKSIEKAFDGTSIANKDGEFSFRLYGENMGYSRTFNPTHEAIVESMYEKLIWSKWNVDPELDCRERPANEFLED